MSETNLIAHVRGNWLFVIAELNFRQNYING